MTAPLLVLPLREENPFGNMATDLWMLRAFPHPECPRFRHYAWDRPCHTFGYGQSMDWVVEQTGASMESLCRRPTGGGVVDHREDWTYALVIPAEHPAAGSQIRASYEALHLALGKAMNLLGAPTKGIPPPLNKGEAGDFPSTPGHCFEEPVAYDLVCLEDGAKVAGAAMKRSREGLLLQGSIQKKRLGDLPWDRLSAVLAQQIADLLKTKTEQIEWPDDWNTSREPFLSEIESIAWQRR